MTFNRESIPSVSSSREHIVPVQWQELTTHNWESLTELWSDGKSSTFTRE
jgi:hypothetical protein